MGKFCFGQSKRILPKNCGKFLFDKTYFDKSNINRKPIIWSKDKIITKFGPKKQASLVLDKVYKNGPKIMENVI